MNAVYARQSLDKKDSLSIETQIELCKQELGIDVPTKVYIDKGFSGKNTNRPQFQEMMKDIHSGVINKVTVYKLDRLSRSLLDFAEMIEVFKQHNVEFQSTREKFDTSTPIGNAMLSIIMVFAQLERETIQLRVRDNYYMRSANGAYDSTAPYGFIKTKVALQGKSVSSLVCDPETTQILRGIFDAYAYTSTSLGALARQLNKRRVPSPGGAAWDSCKLSRIMSNPVYVKANADIYNYYRLTGINITNPIEAFAGVNGCVTYGQWDHKRRKFDQLKSLTLSIGLHEGLVDAQTFLLCQNRLSNNTQVYNGGQGKHSWLTGLIKCGYCGKAMKADVMKKGVPKVRCSGHANYGTCDDNARVSIAQVEEAVETQIMQHIQRHSDLQAQQIAECDVKEQQYKIQINKINEQIDNLVNAIAQGSATVIGYLNDKIAELETQRHEIEVALQKHILERPSPENTRQLYDTLDMWPYMDIAQRHEVAAMLIKEVRIFTDEIRIFWKYDL